MSDLYDEDILLWSECSDALLAMRPARTLDDLLASDPS
jgi:hypothetical protein